MGEMQLPIREVAEVVQVVARATDPTAPLSLDDRRRRLLEAVAKLVGADAWLWLAEALHADGDARLPMCVLDGGWQDEQERLTVLNELGHPTFQPLRQAAASQGSGGEAVAGAHGAGPRSVAQTEILEVSGLSGFEHLLATSYAAARESGPCLVALLRRTGDSPFSERDRIVADLVVENVLWLYAPQPALDGMAAELSPRERDVIQYLLQGHARKEIAAALNLSAHTVADYEKGIYRKFNVKSRTELLAKHIPPESLHRT
jgi:DNA-binding CsgD family transcriptional regulator